MNRRAESMSAAFSEADGVQVGLVPTDGVQVGLVLLHSCVNLDILGPISSADVLM